MEQKPTRKIDPEVLFIAAIFLWGIVSMICGTLIAIFGAPPTAPQQEIHESAGRK